MIHVACRAVKKGLGYQIQEPSYGRGDGGSHMGSTFFGKYLNSVFW